MNRKRRIAFIKCMLALSLEQASRLLMALDEDSPTGYSNERSRIMSLRARLFGEARQVLSEDEISSALGKREEQVRAHTKGIIDSLNYRIVPTEEIHEQADLEAAYEQ